MSSTITCTKVFFYSLLAIFLAAGITSCGGGSSSGPAQAQAPKALIQDYVAKHNTMVDTSLADFYVTNEQPAVAAAVQRTINEKKAEGELENLQNATFDFSNLQIAVVGEKEEYVDDQPTKLLKVSVSGSYLMKQENNSKTIETNETIIFAIVGDSWKVTEKINPWS
ncbi:MAG: hypothetical protein R3297_05555 [Desulfobulbales bacterium]|nr:hypothetical protein [Desulfobulbales bacterium]